MDRIEHIELIMGKLMEFRTHQAEVLYQLFKMRAKPAHEVTDAQYQWLVGLYNKLNCQQDEVIK